MPRSFTDELRDLRGGELVMELTDAMAEMVTAVDEFRKPATLTLKLSVRPATANSAMQVVTDDVKVVLPKRGANETIMYPTPEGSLVVNNPKQADLQFRDMSVSRPAADVKEAPSPAAAGGVAEVAAGQSS